MIHEPVFQANNLAAARLKKPRALIVSHVYPFPIDAGQRQRVLYTLVAMRRSFHVTLAVLAPFAANSVHERDLRSVCDELILLPRRHCGSWPAKLWRRILAEIYTWFTALKRSNYFLGHVELSPKRVMDLVALGKYDCVLFEYWHAWRAAAELKRLGIPTIVDTHNVLWQSYQRDLEAESRAPRWWRQLSTTRYRRHEERAWSAFDALIAINREEFAMIRQTAPTSSEVFYAPMGIDLARWPHIWKPDGVVRLAYYGGLGSTHNQRDALLCATQVMPEIWKAHPSAELWLVGSNPPKRLQTLTNDPRIHVTGFVDDVPDVLRRMSVVLCPWVGTYGFRSRLVEVLAVGTPLVASPDAISGMDFIDGQGISLAADPPSMVQRALRLINDTAYAQNQSRLGRAAVERQYSNENTYDRMIDELADWVQLKRARRENAVGKHCSVSSERGQL